MGGAGGRRPRRQRRMEQHAAPRPETLPGHDAMAGAGGQREPHATAIRRTDVGTAHRRGRGNQYPPQFHRTRGT